MSATVAVNGRISTEAEGRLCTRNEQSVRLNSLIADCVACVFDKPFRALCDILNIGERDAKYRLAEERKYTALDLAMLIRTEEGFKFVTAIMGDAQPEWWRICAPLMEAADIRKMQMAAKRRLTKALEGALDADQQLRQTISRAEALAVHDEEHARPYLDALRAQGRPVHRTMAPSRKR